MHWVLLFNFVLGTSLLFIGFDPTSSYTPEEFAKLAADSIVYNQGHFIEWFYGGAIILDGLLRVNESFQLPYTPVVYKYLDQCISSPGDFGYKILHREKIPWFHNVGDQVGLFPINYLSRAALERLSPQKPADVYIAQTTAMQYVLGFPITLPDGTFARSYGWVGEPNNTDTFLWCDDTYMGFTLVARLALQEGKEEFVLRIAKQSLTFIKYLQDPMDGLFHHGVNVANGHRSCCKWGRANGWVLMALVEVLTSMEHFEELKHTDMYKDILDRFQHQARGICRHQSPTGRWYQVVNESSTFEETSATAMFVSGLSRGMRAGWLGLEDYRVCVRQGWIGLQDVIDRTGAISGVCNGLGIGANLDHYRKCKLDYLTSGNGGLGTVLYAAADYQHLLAFIGNQRVHNILD